MGEGALLNGYRFEHGDLSSNSEFDRLRYHFLKSI